MRLSSRPGASAAVLTALACAMIGAAPAGAPAPPASLPAPGLSVSSQSAARPADPQGRVEFTADIGALYFTVGRGHAREFEATVLRSAELLAESRVATQREQAAGWRFLKSSDAADDAPLRYLLLFEPVVKGADYSLRSIAALADADEARRLEDLYEVAQAGPVVQAEYRVVMSMRPDAGASTAAAGAAPSSGAAPRGRTFAGDLGLQFNFVKADRTEAFESSLAKVREALAASPNPTRRAQADGWRVLRQVSHEPAGQAVYVYLVDPVVEGADYAPSAIVSEALGHDDAEAFSKLYSTVFARGVSLLSFAPVRPGVVDFPDVRPAGADTGSPASRQAGSQPRVPR